MGTTIVEQLFLFLCSNCQVHHLILLFYLFSISIFIYLLFNYFILFYFIFRTNSDLGLGANSAVNEQSVSTVTLLS